MTATDSAELEDRPEPTGTVDEIVSSEAATVVPASTSALTTPATKRPQSGSTPRGSTEPSTATSTRPATSSDVATTERPSRATVVTVHARSTASGSTNPSL